jgi:DNA polymerase-3 subunit delta'
MAMRGAHPDIHEVRRDGASILKDQAEDIIKIASITPSESSRKVIIVHEVHLMAPATAAMLLKTVEEPPSGVFFIMLADQVDDSLATIASRCFTVHFGLLENADIEQALINSGVAPTLAHAAAQSSAGSMSRAKLLASDPQLAQRREFFANIPRRIDGTGATVAAIVEQILELIDNAVEPLSNQHAQEVVDTEKTLALMGVKRGGKKMLEDRHKREIRRYRTDELRSGLTAIASIYRDELARNPNIHRPEAYVTAINRLHEGMRRLSLNVNEAILLRDLIWSLPSPSADAALQFVLSENSE